MSLIYIFLVLWRKAYPISYYGIATPYDTLITLCLLALDLGLIIFFFRRPKQTQADKLVIIPDEYKGLSWDEALMEIAKNIYRSGGNITFTVIKRHGERYCRIIPSSNEIIEYRNNIQE